MPAVRKQKRSKQDDMPYEAPLSAESTPEQDMESPPKRGGPRKRMERKGPWLPAEDAVLVALVNRLGAHSWSKIATHIPGRVGKQCRERYYNHLAPEVNKEPWTPEEELRVMKLHAEHGNAWALISRLLNTGRTANDVKNLWNCALKKKLMENGEDEVMAETQAQVDSGCACQCKRRSRIDRERRTARRSLPQISVDSFSLSPCDSEMDDDADADTDDDANAAAAAAAAATAVARVPVAVLPKLVVPQLIKAEPAVPAQVGALVVLGHPKAEDLGAFLVDESSDSAASSTVVSPPSSASPSPYVASFELLQHPAPLSFFDATPVPAEAFQTNFDAAAPPTDAGVPSWWSQEFDDSDGSC